MGHSARTEGTFAKAVAKVGAVASRTRTNAPGFQNTFCSCSPERNVTEQSCVQTESPCFSNACKDDSLPSMYLNYAKILNAQASKHIFGILQPASCKYQRKFSNHVSHGNVAFGGNYTSFSHK